MTKPADKLTAIWVLRRLREADHKALLAGGCVRDMLLKQRSIDYDIATDATPQQVRKLFKRVLLIGAKFGVAMVIHKGRKVEVTTFRSDLSYSDGRRPDGVRFATPREDAQRRDFTINGMFYDPVTEEVIDYVGGQADLAGGVVRTIGSPRDRFAEDYLRMIRAVRFAVRFGFRVDPATAAAVKEHALKVTAISGERIFDELTKMLSLASAAESLRLLEKLGLAREILPEMFADKGLWSAAVRRVEDVSARRDLTLTLAALLAELPVRTIPRILRRWGAANELRDAVCFVARHRADRQGTLDMPLSEFKRLLASRYFGRLRRLWSTEQMRTAGGKALDLAITRRIAGIPARKIAPQAFVTGEDLKKMGLEEGRRLGQILRRLYDAQLNEELKTRREALGTARQMVGKPPAEH